MKKDVKSFLDIVIRYSVLVAMGFFSFKVFYFLFSSSTVYSVFFSLKLFFETSMLYDVIFVRNILIEIIGPCVAGSAYYLLLILNLSIPGIKLGKRLGILLFSFLSFFIINVLRIFFLSILLVYGVSFFDITHKLFWYIGSSVFVVGIWFLGVKLFRIKEIPFYSDIKFLLKNSGKKTKKAKHSKKH
ncbi:hypothetical protein A3K82_03680 [Candidatus Pacearchaeota archaeon RBG_19FT_COMBO_34_9]|nr:MAG: hypothetical protein A3K82_03680 [Candidatus Pacearchaeota archaeon RBG_19FT_COMBO_34_9]OGJ16142.1 MAG: hypothetical protein A3K74_02840 [Candidatus Pacearchaeota archaeon RBG_13_33_26]